MAVLALDRPLTYINIVKSKSALLQTFLFDTAASSIMDPLQPVPHVSLMMDTFIANSNVEEYVSTPHLGFFIQF